MPDSKRFERWVLPNGLTCYYKQTAGVPLVAATILIRSGTLYEPFPQAGLAALVADLMLLGTRRRSAVRIAQDIESLGATLGAQASEDYTEVAFSAPVESLTKILDVLIDVLTQPTFPLEEVKKERASTLASLESRKDSLFNVAYDAFNAAMFGPAHPYGRPVDGTPGTVQRATREACAAWHRRHIQPNRAVLGMVGPLSFRAAQRTLNRFFKRWAAREALALPLVTNEKAIFKTQLIRIPSRFEQAYLMTGVQAPSILEPDYAALKVLNTVLGGGMSSRLFLRLREEMGLAYEVSSFYPTRILGSQWVIYLGTPPERLGEAAQAMEKLLHGLQRNGPTLAELKQAKAMIKGAYWMDRQTRRRQAWTAAWRGFLGKDPVKDQEFLNAIDRVTLSQVRKLAQRLFSQPRITVRVAPKKAA